jgi:type IV pili sensor histidine kinase/response regulator
MGNNQSIRPIAVIAAVVVLGPVSTYVAGSEARVARYSEISLLPSEAQRDPLLSPVHQRVPDELIVIGDTVDWLLGPSGYRLASAFTGDPERGMLLALPLPDVHRTLEGLPIRTALQTLAGPAFRLVEDPVHRLISFEQCGVTREGR